MNPRDELAIQATRYYKRKNLPWTWLKLVLFVWLLACVIAIAANALGLLGCAVRSLTPAEQRVEKQTQDESRKINLEMWKGTTKEMRKGVTQ